jgi:hypothetical protein
MLVVEIYCFTVELSVVCLSKFHVVDTDTVIRERLTVYITNSFADLKEPFILIDCLLIFAKIIVQYSS